MKLDINRALVKLSLFALCILCFGHASAGEITRADAQSPFKWKSTECLKPTPPPISSQQSSSQRLTKYALDIELYIDCLQREAQRDFDKSQILMQDAVQDELERQTRQMDEMMRQAAKTMR